MTLIANWIPFEEPNGGPNFYPFATDAALQHQRRQRRRRAGRRHLPLDVPELDYRDAATTFLYNNGAGHLARRPEPAVPPDLHAGVVVRRRPSETRIKDATGRAVATSARRRCRTTRKLRDAGHQASCPGGWTDLRRPGRRPVLPRPAGLRPALRRRPVARSARTRSPATTSTRSRCRCRKTDVALEAATPSATRSIGVWSTTDRRVDEPVEHRQRPPRRRPASRCRGWATRWSTRSSCRPSSRTRSTRSRPRQDAQHPRRSSTGSPTPSVPKLIQAIYGIPAPATPRNDLVEIFLTGITKNAPTLTAGPDQGRPQLAV